MKIPFTRLALAVPMLALAACSTPGYQCPLVAQDAGRCSSLEQAYQQSLKANPHTAQQSVFLARNARDVMATQAPESFQGYPQPQERGMPVFREPQVHRVWGAPWTDANGILHGGEYLYFVTPGRWNYGSMQDPGQASGMFQPVKPGKYGFEPIVARPKVQTETTGAPNGGTTETRTLTQGNSAGVTQPYEHLNSGE